MSEVFFEDLKPGQIFSSKTIRVDAGEITAFPIQYDPQPFHLDGLVVAFAQTEQPQRAATISTSAL